MKRVAVRALLAVVAVLGVLWLVFLRPGALGGSTEYVVVEGTSMEPVLRSNDLVVVRERDHYDVGDIVAFRVPEGSAGPDTTIIHRIVGGDAASGYLTQGDNRAAPDEWRPTNDAVLGARIARVPRAGLVLGWLAEPFVRGFAVGAAVTSLVWLFRARDRSAASEPVPAAAAATIYSSRPVDVRPRDGVTPAPAATHRHRRGPSPHDVAANRIRHQYERTTDPDARLRIRRTVFELAAGFASEDPDFDAAAFLRACGAHAYDVGAGNAPDHQR